MEILSTKYKRMKGVYSITNTVKGRNVSLDLVACCKGNQNTAFGYQWTYAN